MSKQFDVLEEYLLYLVDNQDNFLNRDFIMNIFSEAREQFFPYNKFLTCKYEAKQKRCIKGLDINVSHVKITPYKLLINELFDS